MSEDERDIDIESEEDGDMGDQTQAEKRAHHNALERKRRDHIKDSFNMLRDAVPNLQGEKASRAQILNKATEYIQFMRRKNNSHQNDIDDLKKQNELLDGQVALLEKAQITGDLDPSRLISPESISMLVNSKSSKDSESDSDSSADDSPQVPRKRLKVVNDTIDSHLLIPDSSVPASAVSVTISTS
ncbi:protein max-like [Anneissia japonica]|uniref:protein max-like n=1 Tax=Anneissia japonica TaxID=1529436 RepID=UPI0014258B0F|nr:protein max-like [Anneissia japonica]